MKAALHPYLQLTQAVKSGDLVRFGEVVKKFSEQFTADHTYTLITRLHHNVIKTAVKTISLAYSKITFADIAQKLLLDSPDDAEFIVAKAIRDGVIEAELDHDQGIMQSKDTSDVYSTRYDVSSLCTLLYIIKPGLPPIYELFILNFVLIIMHYCIIVVMVQVFLQ